MFDPARTVVFLLHGLKDKEATGLHRIVPYLEAASFKPFVLEYGWFMIRGFVWHIFNTPLARLLAGFSNLVSSLGYSIVCVAHSNGATIAAEASRLGARFDALVFVNGAVERQITLGEGTKILVNCRVPSDPVLAACWVISPVSPWSSLDGSMGNLGVKVNADPREWDVNLSHKFGIVASHGGFFAADRVSETGPWLATLLKWALGGGD